MKPKNLKEALKNKLTKKERQYLISSYDMVGDIAIIEVPYELEKKEAVIADTLLKLHKNINVVVKKISEHKGVFRLQKYKVIAGEKRKKTEYVESGVRMRFNIERVYFSTRFGTERLRIAKLVEKGEDVLVMFSGIAPFPLVIARNSDAEEIYGIEINPVAHKYGIENVRLNKMEDRIKLYEGDVRMVVPGLKKRFDRVVMPLPKGGENFLDMALRSVKDKGIVHFYDFLHVDEFDQAKKKIKEACKKAGKRYRTQRLVKCGQQKPYVFRICLDVRVYD